MFYLLSESGYAASSWYRHIIDGILSEKRTKRFNILMIDSLQETEQFPLKSDDAVLLIGSDLNWLTSVIPVCTEKFGKNIIVLGNFEHPLKGQNYSIVSSDISADVFNLYSYLISYQKTKIAMYGVNPNSASDTYRKNCFVKYCGTDSGIFFNHANLQECYQSFVPHLHQYDAVLCVNDYSAISLVRALQHDGIPLPFIASCGETKLAKTFRPTITNLRTSYQDFGKAAIHIYKLLQKDFSASRIKIELASCILPGDTTSNLPVQTSVVPAVENAVLTADDTFYLDSEVREMLCVENLLHHCDKIESEMLCSLLEGATYFDLAEKYHMSVNGIKYKVNKLFELCNVSAKTEFMNLIKKYMG